MKQNNTGKKNICLWLIQAVCLVILDQLTKQAAVAGLKAKAPFVIIPGVFELSYVENRGAAFGMMQGQHFFFFAIGIVVIAATAYAIYKMPDIRRYTPLRICTTLVTAGAVGNMIDRIVNGYVVDFFYFKLIDFPVFNVADIYVTVSAAVLIFLIGFFYKEEELQFFSWKKPAMESKGENQE